MTLVPNLCAEAAVPSCGRFTAISPPESSDLPECRALF